MRYWVAQAHSAFLFLIYGKDINIRPLAEKAEILITHREALFSMWTQARIYA